MKKTKGIITDIILNENNKRPAMLMIDSTEYCTFDSEIAQHIKMSKIGDEIGLEFHTQTKGVYTNNYIDRIQVLDNPGIIKGKIQQIINSDGDRPDLLYVDGVKYLVPIKEKLVGLTHQHEVELSYIESGDDLIVTGLKCLSMTKEELANEPLSDNQLYAMAKRINRDSAYFMKEFERRDKSLIK